MSRKKPITPAVVIQDLDQANAVLRDMAELQRDIDAIAGDMNAEIDAAKAAAADEAAPRKERLKALEESLAAYATYQKPALFQTRRSVDLVFGAFGFRRSSEVKPKPKGTWAVVLEQLKKLGLTNAIRTKQEINKEVLQEWPDDRLDAVGARRVKKDTFWVEVKQEALEEAA